MVIQLFKFLDVVAAGGRYDSLLSSFEYPGSSSNINGVGVNIALSKIVSKWNLKHQSLSEESELLFRPRISVLISAHASELSSEKLKLLNDLWNSDISAQLSTNESLLNESYSATQFGYNFLLIFKSGKESIKIKNLLSKTEIEGIFHLNKIKYLDRM